MKTIKFKFLLHILLLFFLNKGFSQNKSLFLGDNFILSKILNTENKCGLEFSYVVPNFLKEIKSYKQSVLRSYASDSTIKDFYLTFEVGMSEGSFKDTMIQNGINKSLIEIMKSIPEFKLISSSSQRTRIYQNDAIKNNIILKQTDVNDPSLFVYRNSFSFLIFFDNCNLRLTYIAYYPSLQLLERNNLELNNFISENISKLIIRTRIYDIIKDNSKTSIEKFSDTKIGTVNQGGLDDKGIVPPPGYLSNPIDNILLNDEPILCAIQPVYFPKLKKIVPIKSPNETLSEYNKKYKSMISENEEIDNYNQINYNEYKKSYSLFLDLVKEWELKHIIWRRKNPNWREITIYKSIFESK